MLKDSVGEFISMNSFLSTSLDRRVALFNIGDSTLSDGFECVLFKIDANPRLDNVKPFANITSLSYFHQEDEVLIILGSIFRLIDIYYSEDRVWIIQMELRSDNVHDLTSTFVHMKNE